MFDNKLYYQKNKDRIKEYNLSYYYQNAQNWKAYHDKYKMQEKNIKKRLLAKVFKEWKNKRDEPKLKVVHGPFIV